MNTIQKRCSECGDPFEAILAVERFIHRCNKCVAAVMQESVRLERERIAKAREERWKAICPPLFLDTVREKLPLPHLLDKAMSVKLGPLGLLMHGPTGTGKSRCAFKVLEREVLAGHSVAVLSAASGLDFAASYENGVAHNAAWVRRYKNASVLLCDDVAKSKMSDAFESFLFAVVNFRCEVGKPTIHTLNDTSATLAARLSADRGEPYARRIKEQSTVISFHLPKAKA